VSKLPSELDETLEAVAMPSPRIEWFEPRLALSANIAADWILDAFVGATCSPEPNSGSHESAIAAMGSLHPITRGIEPAAPILDDIQTSAGANTGAITAPLDAAAAVRERFNLDGSGQTVAVIDTGIAWDHIAFSQPQPGGRPLVGFGVGYRVVGGWDFAENDALPYDDGPTGYHGTHVAGIVGGESAGFAGVAPGADLVALRVFDDFGIGKIQWIESALRWVIDNRTEFENPITTVNLSLGVFATANASAMTQLHDELEQLRADGVVVVAAAGNSFNVSRPDTLAYPASHPLVAAVSSVDANGSMHGFSQRAEGVFAAPGGGIVSSIPEHVNGWDGRNDDFQPATGTSMAAPQLAGASMLVRQAMEMAGQTPTPDAILNHLRETSQSLTDPTTGLAYHRLDLFSAIDALLSEANVPPEGEGNTSPSHLSWSNGSTLTVTGTADANQIIVDLSSGVRITVDAEVYAIDRPVDQLIIQGGSGTNSLEIISSSGSDRVILRAASGASQAPGGELVNTQLEALFENFQNIRFVGSGGNDRVTMFDSVGNDTFEASASQATLRGTGFTFVAEQVPNVFAHGTAGGLDTAYLYDSAGDDTLAIRHQFTSLRGENMFRLAYGFERVYAFAGSGGHNQAFLYDSPGNDTLSASASAAWISGQDYYAGARGFDSIRAESSAGGHDIARLYATDENAQWTRAGSLLQMTDHSGQLRSAQGFSRAEGYVAGQASDLVPASIRAAIYDEERVALRELFADFGDESADSNG